MVMMMISGHKKPGRAAAEPVVKAGGGRTGRFVTLS